MAACMSGHLKTARDTGNLPLHRNMKFFCVLVLSREKYFELQFKHWPLFYQYLHLKYSLTSPYGHLYNTHTSLLRTVRLVPDTSRLVTDISVKRTLASVPLVSVLKRFDCMFNFLYALTESISLSYLKKIQDWIKTKRRRKRTGTCKCWTLEQIAYLPGQKEKGLAWLFQLYRCRCWYCREIKQCDCMSNFVVEQIKLNQDIPSNWSFA